MEAAGADTAAVALAEVTPWAAAGGFGGHGFAMGHSGFAGRGFAINHGGFAGRGFAMDHRGFGRGRFEGRRFGRGFGGFGGFGGLYAYCDPYYYPSSCYGY